MPPDILADRDIERSNADEIARTLYYPAEATHDRTADWSVTPTDPEPQPPAWTPAGWAAEKGRALADTLRDVGGRILGAVNNAATDLATSLGGRFEQIPYPEGVPPPEITSQMVDSVIAKLPEHVVRAFGLEPPSDVAGYVYLPDGTAIPVQKYKDRQGAGEKAMSDATIAAIRKANVEDAYNRGKLRIEEEKERTSADQWRQAFALKERAQAQAERLGELQIRAAELAIERETSSPAQRALWGRYQALDPETATASPRVVAIGPGLAGGPIRFAALRPRRA